MLGSKLSRSKYLWSFFGNGQPFKSVSNYYVYERWIVSQQHMQCVSSCSNVQKCITESSNESRKGRIPHSNKVDFQLNYYMRTFAKHPALRSEEKGNSSIGGAGNSSKPLDNAVTAGATSTDASSTTTSTISSSDPPCNPENKSTTASPDSNVSSQKNNEADDQNLTVFQRFKKTYKEHGKVLVGVHLVTSGIWFGSFFCAAKLGVDVIPLMEWLGFSDRIINPFRNSSLGDVALAYLMYKLATPARYTVTLAGTNFMIPYLRKAGKIPPKNDSNSLRNLSKEKGKEVKQRTKQRFKMTSVRFRTNLEASREKFRLKMKERREKFRRGQK
ncbi:uncharacterized protein C18orf19 homolog A-like [Dreissena polymorpha]|uniref:DUF1279 domain-containing protein n=2 Tax=Dreissena polymorpha TaxID=45954 RepID=A0A9D4IJF2_DREPO|nr:uncharacterized protein C18orf19 homolog A-like [Dreissena polymorpha]KAH3776510.1 hypothetical protein DPMN_177937 [Dreissena polymorpha]